MKYFYSMTFRNSHLLAVTAALYVTISVSGLVCLSVGRFDGLVVWQFGSWLVCLCVYNNFEIRSESLNIVFTYI